jgi:S1-C subfamily serine protease
VIYSRVRNSALSCNSVPQSIAAGCAQLLLLWGLLVPATAAPSQPHPAVARIIVAERDGTAFGSGTLVDVRDGYGLVLTNWHVVRDATGSIEVLFPGGFYSQARALKLDRDWDLAALVVWRPPAEPVPLASRPPQPGDRLTIAGYGRGTYRQVSGRCTRYYSPKVHLPKELVELDVEARQGDSGGPIFNDRGELAGVLFGAGRGTTIGSFQGRVKTFLASLAPDIGVPRADSAPQVALAPIESAAPARESSELSRGRLLAARPVETRPIDTRSGGRV